jgi:hypothetical protein
MSRGRLVSWLSVIALAALTLESGILSVTNSGGSPNLTPPDARSPTSLAGFAGYDLIAPVVEVGADFPVPAIISAPKGSFGAASTWIGAQNNGGSFVQVGVTEFIGQNPSGSGFQISYNGFWSSTEKDFHPIEFGTLRAGDLISVGMKQDKQGWVLSFEDRTSGYAHTVATGYGASQSFTAAEWIQEDPTSSAAPLRNLPYPEMSDSVFSSLEVDGKSPPLLVTNGRAMDVPFGGPLLVPGPFVSDGFKVLPAQGPARQYLSDVADYNYAQEAFRAAIDQARPGSLSNGIKNALPPYAQALANFERQLTGQSWPRRAAPDVDSLVEDNSAIASALSRLVPSGEPGRAELAILNDQTIAAQDAESVRRDLGLPPAD